MTIDNPATTFAGRPIRDFDPDVGIEDPTEVVYRLKLDYDDAEGGESILDRISEFLDDPNASHVPAIVIGLWEGATSETTSSGLVEALAAARDRLPHLRGIFIGDITFEECEISWIRQDNVRPVIDAYPQLEHFQVRGGTDLSLDGPLAHSNLRSLVIEAGGLSADVVRDVAASDLPNLEHLELWLGTDNYGGNATIEDLAPILDGSRFPKLEYLGLRDAEISDLVAAAVATAPILNRIKVLDLSLGNLSDAGAEALLQSPAVAKLQKLDLHYHFVSEENIAKLKALGIEVDASNPQQPDEWGGELHRMIAVAE